MAKEGFQSYQASDMCIQKYHALNHIPEMLMRQGDDDFKHAGPYEAARKSSKNDYRLSSRQSRLVIDEIVAKQNLRLAQQKMLPVAHALHRIVVLHYQKLREQTAHIFLGRDALLAWGNWKDVLMTIKTIVELNTVNLSFAKLWRIIFDDMNMMASTF